MLKRCTFPLLPALAVTAIAVTGCGGSSKKSNTTPTSTGLASSQGSGTTQTGSGTQAGGTSQTGTGTQRLGMSTPLSSAIAQKLFREEGLSNGLSSSQATSFVSCLENKFSSQGLTTFSDASSNPSRTKADAEACALQVKSGG